MPDFSVIETPRRTKALRLTIPGVPPVRCPAGIPVAETESGSGCRCTVEGTTLTTRFDPGCLDALCFGDYTMCSSWQAQRDTEDEGYQEALAAKEREDRDRRERMERHGMIGEEAGMTEVTYYENPDIDET